MDTLRHPNINFPIMNVFGAVAATLIILIFLSNLSKIKIAKPPADHKPPVVITQKSPPQPPEPVQIEEAVPTLVENVRNAVHDNPPVGPEAPPAFDPVLKTNSPVIGNYTKNNLREIKLPKVTDIFSPSQVDQRPYAISRFDPVYPFAAKASGIEGRVVLRFVVDEKGKVLKPEVLRAEPEGVFEESALAAILKFRFKPAAVGDRAVKCFVVMPMGFELEN